MNKRQRRASRCACAVVLTAVLLPPTAQAMLAPAEVVGLAVNATSAAVQVGARVFVFDHDGSLLREMAGAVPPAGARLVSLTDDGTFWFVPASIDEGEGTRQIVAIDETGAIVFRENLPPGSTAYVSPAGAAFAGMLHARLLDIEKLGGADRIPHAEIPLQDALDDDEAISWAVLDDGDVLVLVRESERGRVMRFRPDGRQVRTWQVSPDPVTSVAYMREVLIGADGFPYVTHGSWEVSSSSTNSGSLLRLDPSGGEAFRIKDGIGYLQRVAVAPSGDVFVSDLSEQVVRFSRNGERAAAWIAVPPRFGESWDERNKRIAAAGRVGPDAAVGDLLTAIVYGNHDIARRASGALHARGAAALSEVTSGVTRFPGAYSLAQAAEGLWEAHPIETARLFEISKEDSVRRTLAPVLAYREPLTAGVREVLARMVLEGNNEVGHALDHVGPTPEVVRARITAFRRALRTGGVTFDPAYHLKNTYPASIDALESILLDAADPDRAAMRTLILEGFSELATPDRESGKARPIPPGVLERSLAWSRNADPFVREAAAVALTSLRVTGHEAAAVAAAQRTPDLLEPTLRAFALLATAHRDAVTPHVQALSRLSRGSTPTGSTRDALEAFARIPHAAVLEECLKLLTDESLPAGRRGDILIGVETAAIPRARLLALLREQGWQRSLAREYFYHSFLEDVFKAYPRDVDVRAEMKATLLGLVSDPELGRIRDVPGEGVGPGVQALNRLALLVEPADLPRLAPLLDDPRMAPGFRAALVNVLSHVPPDDALRGRLRPLLRDPDVALSAARALGRAGDRAALEVLVEQGLKRLGYYSRIALDVDSFRPLGADAERALLALLDYPNQSTREVVRQLLVEWPSDEGRRRIRGELDEAVAAGRAPGTATLGALAGGGEDVTAALVTLATAHPEAVGDLTPEHGAGPLTLQLRAAIARETDAGRRRTLEKLASRLCGCEGG
jgi:hypothetical protein